jgi:hypothetical protein
MARLLLSILPCGFFEAIQSPTGKPLKALGNPYRGVAIPSRIREVCTKLHHQAVGKAEARGFCGADRKRKANASWIERPLPFQNARDKGAQVPVAKFANS